MGTFLEWLLESSLLVLMVLGIRKAFMGKIRYAAMYSLWMVVMLRFLIPVNFVSTPVSIANLFPKSFSAQQDMTADGQGHALGLAAGLQGRQDTVAAHTPSDATTVGQNTAASTANAVFDNQDMDSALSGAGRSAVSGTSWYTVFRSGRFVIAILLLLWFVVSNASLLRAVHSNRVFYGYKDKIKIYMVSNIQTPCLYGFLRPAIYLPSAFLQGDCETRVSEEELEQMITHEYVHYCHGDHIWAILRIVLVSVYWYDPFAWIAAFYSKKDAELFCDETVIRILGEENRFRYGRMLVRLAGTARWGDFRYSMMLMSKRGKEMEQRIRAISRKQSYSKWLILPLIAALAVAVGVTCSSGIRSWATDAAETKAVASEVQGLADEQQNSTETQDSGQLRAGTYEKAFDNYIEKFTDAVNTGSVQQLHQVMLPGSDVYEQQCAIVQNYYKRGIREKIISYSISSVKKRTADCVAIDSEEEILVHYADQTSKVVKQKYRYTCEYISQSWIITEMQSIDE